MQSGNSTTILERHCDKLVSKCLAQSNLARLNHERRKLFIGTEDEDIFSGESESGSDLDDPVRFYTRRG